MRDLMTYISGADSNRNDLDALIDGGYAFCIEVCGARATAIEKVIEYVKKGGQTLIDSGAFGVHNDGKKVDFQEIM